MEGPKGYVICSNPRSGTTLLCDMLLQTGVAGNPNSFFREKSLRDWCDHWGIPQKIDPNDAAFSARYFEKMLIEGRGPTDMFGVRVMGPDLTFACAWLARRHPEITDQAKLFAAEFGPVAYVHLKRQDKLAEAVSYVRAEQTGLWHAHSDGSDMERIAPTQTAGYDRLSIQKRLDELTAYDVAWEHWFNTTGIEPLRLTYETLADDPVGTLAQVLSHIGQNPAFADQVKPGLQKLANAVNAAWIARYLSEME